MKSLLSLLVIFLIAVSCSKAFPQDNVLNVFRVDHAKTTNPSMDHRKSVEDAVIFNINKEVYNALNEQRTYKINLAIPVTLNQNIYANLERTSVLAPNAKIVERDAAGEHEVDLRNEVLSYTGKINGDDNSLVSISFHNGTMLGMIVHNGQTYTIGALTDRNGKDTDDLIIYNESKVKFHRDIRCGSDRFGVPAQITDRIRESYGKYTDMSTTTLLEAKIAVDVDYFTYQTYGSSVPNATAYTMALMSATSAVYAKDENVKLLISYLRVWTTQDPYTSNSGNVLLDQFRNDWIATQGGVERVIAHLVSRRNSIDVGGIAYLNVLCNTNFGYGLSSLLGTINQLPSYSYDVVVVAHEMGHNFGSPHTHNCSWVGGPIDTCYFVEGGCYGGPNIPTVGTIMSYCDTEGGTVVMNFGPQPTALIRNSSENAGCITASANPVFTAYPNGGETFRTNTNANIYWGTSLTGNVNIEYSTNNGSTWSSIANNVNAQDRQYTWAVPYIGYTNQAKVRIMESGNPSVGDTSDAAFKIILQYNTFNVQSPPTQTRLEVNPQNSDIQNFTWGSAGTHPTLRYTFKIRKIGAGAVDYIFTSNNDGADSSVSFRKSLLDSVAQMIGTTGDSVRCSWRAWAYNGFDSVASSNTFLITLVRVPVGITQISSSVPEKFDLHHNYPNPFNPSTVIKFDVAKFQKVKITIYDVRGRAVEEIVNENLQPGSYQAVFNGVNYPSGAYYYRMETADYVQTRKMILVK